LPYATPVFVKRLRRYQVKVRRSFSEGGSVVRLRAVVRSRQNRPANTLHADAAASTASHPASVTTRDPPLMRDEMAELIVLIWGEREGNCFCRKGWTWQIMLIWLGKLAFWRNVRGSDHDRRFATSQEVAANKLTCDLAISAKPQPVGWVERSDTHRSRRRTVMGFATLYPSYEIGSATALQTPSQVSPPGSSPAAKSTCKTLR
jgi:hypothetical protein